LLRSSHKFILAKWLWVHKSPPPKSPLKTPVWCSCLWFLRARPSSWSEMTMWLLTGLWCFNWWVGCSKCSLVFWVQHLRSGCCPCPKEPQRVAREHKVINWQSDCTTWDRRQAVWITANCPEVLGVWSLLSNSEELLGSMKLRPSFGGLSHKWLRTM
jgi:hypothetical protein